MALAEGLERGGGKLGKGVGVEGGHQALPPARVMASTMRRVASLGVGGQADGAYDANGVGAGANYVLHPLSVMPPMATTGA